MLQEVEQVSEQGPLWLEKQKTTFEIQERIVWRQWRRGLRFSLSEK